MMQAVSLPVTLKAKYLPEYDYVLTVSYYGDTEAPALIIFTQNGERMLVATTNLSNRPAKNCVFIKDWSENEGISDALIEAGIIEKHNRLFATGHVVVGEHPMAPALLEAWQEVLKLNPTLRGN